MRNYEYKANSVDEAIKQGLKELNLSEDKVKIEVVEAGSAGIFGLFKKEALVRLTPLDADYSLTEQVSAEVETQAINKEEKFTESSTTEEKVEKEAAVLEKTEEKSEQTENAPKQEEVKETDTTETAEETKEVAVEEVKVKKVDKIVENKEAIVTYIRDIVHSMGFKTATVEFQVEASKTYVLRINDVENSSLLIGKRGNTLNSLQYLANNYAKKFTNHFFKIIVDCEDYRENRKATLEELALNMAKKSKKLGRPVELEPMTSEERKIIHGALSGIKNVETLSEGKEPHRYLIITAW
ncbi:MAG: RNA-binding cell elongation regulator Jag/EloR [Gemella sp.]|nr:RNA-binding cell elongation regulator Jag/EloR [Gemella sp.]